MDALSFIKESASCVCGSGIVCNATGFFIAGRSLSLYSHAETKHQITKKTNPVIRILIFFELFG
jgi:hypothetical protein